MITAVVVCLVCGLTTSAMALPQYTLTYTCGNGSGTPPAAVTVSTGDYLNVAENTCTAPSGQYFSHWSCSNSPSTQYSAGAQYDIGLTLNADTGDVTCVAQWTSTLSCPVTYNYGSCSKSYNLNSSAYGSSDGDVRLIPTVSQVCETDSNCDNVSSCIGNGNFQGWNCGNTLQRESCTPEVSGSIFAPGTECKLYYDSESNCGATCTAIYDYTVSYNCGTGSGTPSSGTVTTNQSFTFAAANACTGASGATFTGWSCDNGVGNKSAGQTISSWNYNTGTTCTAQWKGGTTPSTSCDKECETKNIADSEFGNKSNINGQQVGYIDANRNATNAERVGISDINTWGVGFDYGTITGSAMCDETRPSGDVLVTTGNPVGTTGIYCWCNANKYTPPTGSAIDLITDWIYTYQFGNSIECDARCAEMCASEFKEKQQMRETVYGTGTYCECPSYTVTYSCGSGASGTAPTDATQYSSGDTVTTSASAGNCSKSNSTFIGWTCGGTDVNAGGTFNINGDTTCSARWQTTQIQFYVGYHQGTAGNAPIYGGDPTAPTSCIYGETCNAPNNTYTVDGYTFTGWSCTSNSGTCTQATYQPGDSISTATSVNGAIIQLIAQWRETQAGPSPSACDTGYHIEDVILSGNVSANDMDYTENGTYTGSTAVFSYGTITAVGICSSQSGSQFDTETSAPAAAITGQPAYCWCHATQYNGNSFSGNMPYVYLYPHSVSYEGICGSGCSGSCGRALGGAVANGGDATAFRQALYTTTSCVKNTFVIQYDGNGYDGGVVPSTHTCEYDETCTAASHGTLEKTNYTFTGWAVTCKQSDGVTDCTPAVNTVQDSGDLTNITTENGATITLTAQWADATYNVTYSCGGASGSAPVDNVAYVSGSLVNILANSTNNCTMVGGTFAGWKCNGVDRTPGTTFAIDYHTSCVAKWNCDTGYTKSESPLNSFAGTSVISSATNASVSNSTWSIVHSYGTVSGSALCSSVDGLIGQTQTSTPSTSGNKKYCWCKVTGYTTNGGGSQSIDYLPWTRGAIHLDGVSTNPIECTDNRLCAEFCYEDSGYSKPANQSMYMYSTCTPNDYTITLNDNGGSGGSGTIYTTYNTNVYNDSARSNAMTTSANPVAIPTYSNRTFQGYYSAITGGTQYIDVNGRITTAGLAAGKGYTDNNQTWYAHWSVETFNVRYSCGVGTGTAPTDNQNYQNGATVVAKPNTCSNSGGSFAGWSCNGVVVNAGSTFTITGHTLCVAQWNCSAGYHEYNPLIEHTNLVWDANYSDTTNYSMTIPNVGAIQIKAMISSESGIDSNRYPIAMYYEPNKPTTTTETEGYCWCRVTGFTPTNGTYESIDYLPWIPISGQMGSTESCQEIYCREFLASSFPYDQTEQNKLMARKTALCTGSKCVPNTFNVVYAGNDNDGGSAPSAPTTCTYGETCNAPSNTYTKTGYDFDKWACSADSGNCASGTYSASADISTATTINNATITLTAQWSGTKINLKWRSNGDAITTTPEYCYYGSLANTPGGINDIQQPTKRGYTFAGWKVTAWQDN